MLNFHSISSEFKKYFYLLILSLSTNLFYLYMHLYTQKLLKTNNFCVMMSCFSTNFSFKQFFYLYFISKYPFSEKM